MTAKHNVHWKQFFAGVGDYRNSLFEVCRAVSLLEARVEEFVEAGEEDV
jgi:hypothetical protein